ncbi:MAG: hypothetical protein EZS28_045348 [Streblomastix strix]|uniref:Uncharacterized protein n=1 Tax=Streblomastix strix TaxID=222440 RepID=A0A5J4TNU8_9EUKA|nr:MAG: hypothetical protein EZS28_045348 [Streblomastix strix]
MPKFNSSYTSSFYLSNVDQLQEENVEIDIADILQQLGVTLNAGKFIDDPIKSQSTKIVAERAVSLFIKRGIACFSYGIPNDDVNDVNDKRTDKEKEKEKEQKQKQKEKERKKKEKERQKALKKGIQIEDDDMLLDLPTMIFVRGYIPLETQKKATEAQDDNKQTKPVHKEKGFQWGFVNVLKSKNALEQASAGDAIQILLKTTYAFKPICFQIILVSFCPNQPNYARFTRY